MADQPRNQILQNNQDIEVLRDQILRLEETGYLPKFDYQTCQPVMVAREPRPA